MTNTNISQNDGINDDDKDVFDTELEGAGGQDGNDETKKTDDYVMFPKSKIVLAKKILQNIRNNNDQLIQLLGGFISPDDEDRISIGQSFENGFNGADDGQSDNEMRIIEGVFDGENMVGPDGKVYSVPANYASKSKLVEGDIMKLTITDKGTFVYKQIGPIDRNRVVGILSKDADGAFYVSDESKRWRVLTASVTYFKGSIGDEVVILVPKAGESKWAAIENIVHN